MPVQQKWEMPRRAVVKKQAKRQRYLERRKVREIVYRREAMTCQRCGKKCKHPRECYAGDPDRAEVNEPDLRSLGADPLDPTQCELVCHQCHFSGPSGAHAPTADRMVKR
jgi:5-methylcytosine-specific restriction endonuclease McrA